MKHSIGLMLCAAALAACNKGPDVNVRNASVGEVAEKVEQSGIANETFLRAGEWKVTGTMEEMNVPGMPPQAQEEMKRVMGQVRNTSYEYCVTPEEAKRPREKMFAGKDADHCRYEHFTVGGGKFDAAMRCEAKNGSQPMTMAVNGTYSPDSYQTHVSMNVEGGPQGAMSMKMRSEAHRVGECSAKDLKEAKG